MYAIRSYYATGLVQVGVLAAAIPLSARLAGAFGAELWPTRWPWLAQLVLALVVAELPKYWMHRLEHTTELLWRIVITSYSIHYTKLYEERLSVRQVLCHEAGLYRIRDMIGHAGRLLDWKHMTDAIACSAPCHEPGRAHGYHGWTYGRNNFV